MEIREFLRTVIDGYLLHDLENMVTFTPQEGTYGALGYPIMQAILAGMELLGNLLMPSKDPFIRRAGDEYFYHYWNNYLLYVDPRYKGIGKLFRILIRHGIAHTFVGKPRIIIYKDESKPSIQLNQAERILCVNAIAFFRDFRNSYDDNVRKIINDAAKPTMPNIQSMQTRLDSMLLDYNKQAVSEFDNLTDLDPFIFTSGITVTNVPVAGTGFASLTNVSAKHITTIRNVPLTESATRSKPDTQDQG